METMYEAYWGLAEPAFALAPDPKFFYLSPSHEEAMLLLHHHVARRDGIAILAGAGGAGKSSLLRRLTGLLPGDILACTISGASTSEASLGSRILACLRLDPSEANLDGRLASIHETGRKVVVAIDDANRGDVERNFREVERLLRRHPWMTFVFVGDAQLASRVTSDLGELFELSVRTSIGTLDAEATAALIQFRLRVAGYSGDLLPFDEDAIAQIAMLSGGNPRFIVQWADHGLLQGFVESRDIVDGALIQALASNISGMAA